MTGAEVRGSVAAGFDAVADAFRANFARGAETGAAVSVYRNGEPVVQLYAGVTDDGSAFTGATRSVVFSVSKGITTICVLMAAEQGLLSLDAPVAEYWPEFAANGKSTVTLRQMLAHRAGLVAPDEPMTMQQLRAWFPVADALAAQEPTWEPGTAHAYHAITFGWLAGEALRRATGHRPAEWLQHHIAEPLGIQLSFGVDPSSADFSYQIVPPPSSTPDRPAATTADLEAVAMQNRIMGMHGAFDGAHLFDSANRPDFLAAELPAANLVATADELAQIYAATVGGLNGVELLQPATVRDALRVQSSGPPFLGADWGLRWGTGFMIDSPQRRMAGAGSFGHDGAGGQLAFAHAETGVSFAYVTNQPGGDADSRAESLCEALRTCL
ncbi:serine hydrolase domain-containing protein [Curtobacterium sp. 1544]|uniref:serine hydrolase domain-containing protein n=1 Tax=Curtobacterium sp. 1544 TaxID=3156417 RepID=UPI0033919398